MLVLSNQIPKGIVWWNGHRCSMVRPSVNPSFNNILSIPDMLLFEITHIIVIMSFALHGVTIKAIKANLLIKSSVK
jgi:hypothetical protein